MYTRIEKQILRLIGENPDSPDVFIDQPDAMRPIRQSIAAARQEIILLTDAYRERCLLPLIRDQQWYVLRWDRGSLAYIVDAWLLNQKRRLEQTTALRENDLDRRWRLNRGTPEVYWQIGFNTIAVAPRPTDSTNVLDIWAVVMPERDDDGREYSKIPEDWDWATIHYAVGEFYASRGAATDAILHQQQYMDALGKAVGRPMSVETRRQFMTRKEPWPTEGKRA